MNRLAELLSSYHKFCVFTVISDGLRSTLIWSKFQNFPGGACPQTPLQRYALYAQKNVALNAMTFNATKCKAMIISRKRNQCLPPAPLTPNGTIVEVVPTFKYLGILLSSDLSWTHHIQGVCSKARKILGLLYRRY